MNKNRFKVHLNFREAAKMGARHGLRSTDQHVGRALSPEPASTVKLSVEKRSAQPTARQRLTEQGASGTMRLANSKRTGEEVRRDGLSTGPNPYPQPGRILEPLAASGRPIPLFSGGDLLRGALLKALLFPWGVSPRPPVHPAVFRSARPGAGGAVRRCGAPVGTGAPGGAHCPDLPVDGVADHLLPPVQNLPDAVFPDQNGHGGRGLRRHGGGGDFAQLVPHSDDGRPRGSGLPVPEQGVFWTAPAVQNAAEMGGAGRCGPADCHGNRAVLRQRGALPAVYLLPGRRPRIGGTELRHAHPDPAGGAAGPLRHPAGRSGPPQTGASADRAHPGEPDGHGGD